MALCDCVNTEQAQQHHLHWLLLSFNISRPLFGTFCMIKPPGSCTAGYLLCKRHLKVTLSASSSYVTRHLFGHSTKGLSTFKPTSYTTLRCWATAQGAQRLNWLFIWQWSWSTSHNMTFEQFLVTWVGTDFVRISRQLDEYEKIWNNTSICFFRITHHNIPEWIWMLVRPSLHAL